MRNTADVSPGRDSDVMHGKARRRAVDDARDTVTVLSTMRPGTRLASVANTLSGWCYRHGSRWWHKHGPCVSATSTGSRCSSRRVPQVVTLICCLLNYIR